MCYTCFTHHEVDNEFAPVVLKSPGFFSQACKHCRYCISERVPRCVNQIPPKSKPAAVQVSKNVHAGGARADRAALKLFTLHGFTAILKDNSTGIQPDEKDEDKTKDFAL